MQKAETPQALKAGHENLYSDLEAIMSYNGKVGEKAKQLKEILKPHFEKEEKYALPPLGLLIILAEGHWELDANEAISMADKLEKQLSEMKNEHAGIINTLQKLKVAAEGEDNAKAKRFVKDLALHIDIEDQVLYPATILVGNYLKKFNSSTN